MFRRFLPLGFGWIWLVAGVARPAAANASKVWVPHERPGTGIHVARLPHDGPFATRLVLASDRVAERMEPVSQMCRRSPIACVVGINGDFGDPKLQQPIGGVIVGNRLVRSPDFNHFQVTRGVGGELRAGYLPWSGALVTSDGGRLALDAVNRQRDRDQIVLYTREFAPTTRTGTDGFELVLHVGDALRLGAPVNVRLAKPTGAGGNGLFEGVAVVSGHGRGAVMLRALWDAVVTKGIEPHAQLALSVDGLPAGGVDWSVGCAPVLLAQGRPVRLDGADPNVVNWHPRTILGWTPRGDMTWVVVDGRRPGYSMGLRLQSPAGVPEAAQFMRDRFGVTDACNLDGGGSSTFVLSGRVVNRPCCDPTERPVAMALVADLKPGFELLTANAVGFRAVVPPPPPRPAPPPPASVVPVPAAPPAPAPPPPAVAPAPPTPPVTSVPSTMSPRASVAPAPPATPRSVAARRDGPPQDRSPWAHLAAAVFVLSAVARVPVRRGSPRA